MKYVYKTEPWAHQKRALAYLCKRDAAALYTDMGTGKTKVMIDMMQTRKFQCVLVVAPNKACEVWEEQISIHGVESQFCVLRLNQYSVEKVINLLTQSAPNHKRVIRPTVRTRSGSAICSCVK